MHDTLLNAIIILQFTCIFLIWQSEWGCAISIKENSSLRQHDLLSLHGLGKIFTSPYKNWSPVPEIAFYLFIEDPIFASQEIWWVKLTPLWVTFSLPISCKQFKIPSVWNNLNSLLLVFWWTWTPTQFKIHSAQQDSPVSKIRSRLRKRLYGWGWLHYRSAIGHLSLTHSSRSILHSDTVQFRKQFSHSSLCFLVDQVLAHRSRLRKRLYGWSWLQSRSAVSHLSLTHSSRSILHSDTVQFRKQFSHSSICFLVD